MKRQKYMPRFYREILKKDGLIKFEVVIEESDLHIQAEKDLEKEAYILLKKYREQIKDYIKKNPEFLRSLKPYEVREEAPLIIKEMAEAAKLADVGPMASVAGAIAEFLGRDLMRYTPEIIIENGGDTFLKLTETRTVAIFSGDSIFNLKIGLEISPDQTPISVCTSSATVGHSLSFGRADAVVTVSASGALSDASATAICNLVKTEEDIESAIEFSKKINDLKGVVLIIRDRLAVWGDLKIVDLERGKNDF